MPASKESLKFNILNLVKHHREHCNTGDCNVSLWLVLELAMTAGLTFSPDEQELFR